MRRGVGPLPLAATIIVAAVSAVSAEAHAAARPIAPGASRPYLYGSGYIYGSWKNAYAGDASKQQQWDQTSLKAIAAMGAKATGASFNWCDIERARGTYNWTETDQMVANAAAAGLEMFAYTGNTPDWAIDPSHKGLGYRFPPLPQFTADFERFFQALAARYRGKVKYLEFWNEQNGCSWINDGCANGNMAPSYAPWLCKWYNVTKAGNPDAVLSVGGLDYNAGVAQGYQYIEDLYSAGAGHCFDAVAFHPYDNGSPGHEIHYQAVVDLTNTLAKHGDADKLLWMNEFGWNSSDEDMKSKAMTTVLQAITTNFTNIFSALYLSLTDLPGVPDSGHGYGLMSQNTPGVAVTPRASYTAFQKFPKS